MFFVGVEIGVEHITTVEIDLAANIVSTNVEPFDGASIGVDDGRRARSADGVRSHPGVEAASAARASASRRRRRWTGTASSGWRRCSAGRTCSSPSWCATPCRCAFRSLAENDANAFAIGATYGRSELHAGVTLFLVMESGVGGGIIIDGSLFRGANGLAGEIGHLIVSDAPGPGRNLEQVIGLENIMQRLPQTSGRRRADIPELPRRCRATACRAP